MASIGTFTLSAQSADKVEKVTVKYQVRVGGDGVFATTLRPEYVESLKAFGATLATNRMRNEGYFSATTLKDLHKEIKDCLEECVSRTLVKSEIVLKYAMATACSFGLTLDGKIIPNLGWTEDGEIDKKTWWLGGNVPTHAARLRPTGVEFYVKASVKNTYEYKSGAVRIEYQDAHAFGGNKFTGEGQYYLRWLANITSTKPPSTVRMREILYTEKAAKFFVDIYRKLCKMAHALAQFENEDFISELIETGKSPLILEE
jgi:hypothetical protein